MMANLDQTEILSEIWEKIVEFIPVNKRDDAALVYLETINNDETLEFDKIELIESHTILDSAYRILTEDEDIDIDEEDYEQ